MHSILSQIVADKRAEVERLKRERPLAELERIIAERKPALDFARALAGNKTRIIAEVKRASPSKGDINPDLDPVETAIIYERAGAAAISVLTESRYFKGSIDYLAQIRDAVAVPLLRKDFIFDPYQVYEARSYGADSLLLIAAILNQDDLSVLLKLSASLGMDCLVEVHDEREMERAIRAKPAIIGINNRDLKDFSVNINTTGRLLPMLPQGTICVSESGIKNRNDIEMLNEWQVNAALIGESLVAAVDIEAKMKEFVL